MTEAATAPARWFAKKTLRGSVALATRSARVFTPASRAGELRVLTYHRFARTARDPFAVTPERFREQMAWVAENSLAATIEDVEFVLEGGSLERHKVLISIDDGVQSVHDQALPILREFGLSAMVFITPSLIGAGRGTSDLTEEWLEPFMTWDEVEALAAAGLSIGSHAWTHHSLGGRSDSQVNEEAARSKKALEERLGRPIHAFAYPFGTWADFNDTIAEVLRSNGYRLAFTSQHGRIQAGLNPLQLPRIKVEGGEGLWLFKQLTRGALDAWQLIDRGLWRVQARLG